jgi:hypothetical protein
MKKFETPVVEIEELKIMDVIATSTCEDDVIDCSDDMGLV